MPTVLITGGTGMIGSRLTSLLLAKGYEVMLLTRQLPPEETKPGVSYARWNVKRQTIDTDAIARADYIVHLAGAGVAGKRWSNERKKEIVSSRTRSSALIIQALKETDNTCRAVISASAIGWYGPDTSGSRQNGFAEEAPANNDFLGTTCRLWEESLQPVTALGKRLVICRTGIVLSNEGGAFPQFKKTLKAHVAAILGNGRQVISWIHVDDLCQIYLHAIEQEQISGVYNAVAPQPVTNRELMLILAKKLYGHFFLPIHVPAFLLRMLLGEMSIEVLKSTTVSCRKIIQAGFGFRYAQIEEALTQLVKR